MRNIELKIKVINIENKIDNRLLKTDKKSKTIVGFEISSLKEDIKETVSFLNGKNNKLLAFGNMSNFVVDIVKPNDILLVKGDLREVSSTENILLASNIMKIQ